MSFYFQQAKAQAARAHRSGVLRWLAHLGIPGLFAVSAVDASVIPLAIPGSTDLLLLWMISHGSNPYVMVATAVAGSLLGGYTTWQLGRKGGEAAIKRYVPQRLQSRVTGSAEKHPALAVMLPAMLPPPIPLWPFLLASGALGVSWRRFLAAFGVGRTVRYGLVGWLAIRYGRHMIRWWQDTLAKWSEPILWTFIVLTAMGLVYGIWKFRRQKTQDSAQPALQPS